MDFSADGAGRVAGLGLTNPDVGHITAATALVPQGRFGDLKVGDLATFVGLAVAGVVLAVARLLGCRADRADADTQNALLVAGLLAVYLATVLARRIWAEQ